MAEHTDSAADPSGRLFVLVGPSGVGKSTVVARIRAARPDLWFSVSATTRAPRPGDVDGESYYFVSPEEFAAMVDDGQMLEWARFSGNLYGTPSAPVLQRLAAGRDVLLEVELQGARQVRAALGAQAELIFLAPPSLDELAVRLARRGTEDAAVQAARLEVARSEMAAQHEFDHVVVNAEVTDTVARLLDFMAGQHHHQAQPADQEKCP